MGISKILFIPMCVDVINSTPSVNVCSVLLCFTNVFCKIYYWIDHKHAYDFIVLQTYMSYIVTYFHKKSMTMFVFHIIFLICM